FKTQLIDVVPDKLTAPAKILS
ncbi:hypothetical protein MGSAQ_001530, partial [marine sediment metagenome]